MKQDKKATKEDLLNFIRSQRDDRWINMDEPNGDNECGCLLVHFGRKYFRRRIKDAGWTFVVNDRNQYVQLSYEVETIIGLLLQRQPKTYGEVKKILKL